MVTDFQKATMATSGAEKSQNYRLLTMFLSRPHLYNLRVPKQVMQKEIQNSMWDRMSRDPPRSNQKNIPYVSLHRKKKHKVIARIRLRAVHDNLCNCLRRFSTRATKTTENKYEFSNFLFEAQSLPSLSQSLPKTQADATSFGKALKQKLFLV